MNLEISRGMKASAICFMWVLVVNEIRSKWS